MITSSALGGLTYFIGCCLFYHYPIHLGLGRSTGAIVGGLLLGLSEAYTAGYISSDYKDAVPFVIILAILFFLPNGLFGSRAVERV